VLSVGQLEPRKDQETLLRGFALFRSRFPEAELHLAGPVGDREYRDRLMDRAKRNGWERQVRFLGKVGDLDARYRTADLFVSTSRDEGLGLAVLEAMSYGLPVICTPVAGHKDFVEDGQNARVIPVGDFRRLAQTIGELHSDANMRIRLGEKARQTVREEFSWPVTVRKYDRVFRRILTPSTD
jgi:glycosyltransferase involved in cell wall biosynthesis